MVGVRFTKEELAALRAACAHVTSLIGLTSGGHPLGTSESARQAALRKLEIAELTKRSAVRPAGIGARAAIQAMRGVLGDDLVHPAQPSSDWFVRLARAIAERNMTTADCVAVARAAQLVDRAPYEFERLVYQSASLLRRAVNAPAPRGRERTSLPESSDL